MRCTPCSHFKVCVLLIAIILLSSGTSSHGDNAKAHENATDQRERIVLYERPVTDAERKRYEIGTTSGPLMPEERSLQELTKYYKSEKVSWRIVKVVAVKDQDGAGYHWRIKTTMLGDDLIRQRNEQEWREGPAQKMLADIDDPHLKRTRTMLKWRVPQREIYYPDVDHLEFVWERLEGPKRRGLIAQITVVPGRKLGLHEFFRQLMRHEFSVEQTEIGPVLLADDDEEDSWAGSDASDGGIGVAWIANRNTKVLIGGKDVSLKTIIDLYGDKYPSTLPKDVSLDRVAWGKEEVARTLKYLKREIENPTPPQRHPDMFDTHIDRLRDNVWCRVLPEDITKTRDLDKAGKQKMYDKIKTWWKKNKNNVYWDSAIDKLAVRGTVTEKMRRQARRGLPWKGR